MLESNTFPADGKYRLEATVEPDADGHYRVCVYHGNHILDTTFRTNRDQAIEDATKYATWHRAHSGEVEVIEL